MCYTYETSIHGFVIGTIASLFLFFSKVKKEGVKEYIPKMLGILFMFVSLMQYYDSVFWSNPPPSKKNEKYTKIAAITNNIQPLVVGLVIYYYKGSLSSMSKKLLLVYAIMAYIYTKSEWNTLKYTEVTEESKPSLFWKWNHFNGSKYFYLFFVFILNYLFINEIGGSVGKFIALAVTLTFVYSLWKYDKILSLGRFWCYYAALLPLVFILILT